MKRTPKHNAPLAAAESIEPAIRIIRGRKVILDADLAAIYGVTTARLNQQVNRNLKKFPQDFMFRLDREEFLGLMLQNATSKKGRGGRRKLPYAFTEHDAVMAANVLKSEQAIEMSVYVVRAFVKLREVLSSTDELAKKLDALERKLTAREDVHEKAILQLFAQIRNLLTPPPPQPTRKRRPIGF